MRVYLDTFVALLLLFSSTTTLAHPQPITDIQLMPREQAEALDARNGVFGDISTLWKRKGGGGGGGKGGGGGSGGSSSGGSGSSGKGSSSSNSGGATKTGSGVTPNYGGGRYYGGGSKSPYASGGRSPAGIVAVPLLVGAGALALYPGYHLYPYGAYAYPYYHPYGFYNRTGRRNATNSTNTRREVDFEMIQIRQTTTTGINETKPVTCLCAMYAVCGCDDNGNKTFLDSLIGDGTYANLNLSLVDVAVINGTSTIVINGTLPNGTTAAGGTEDAFGAATALTQASGYWVMIALVAATVYMV